MGKQFKQYLQKHKRAEVTKQDRDAVIDELRAEINLWRVQMERRVAEEVSAQFRRGVTRKSLVEDGE